MNSSIFSRRRIYPLAAGGIAFLIFCSALQASLNVAAQRGEIRDMEGRLASLNANRPALSLLAEEDSELTVELNGLLADTRDAAAEHMKLAIARAAGRDAVASYKTGDAVTLNGATAVRATVSLQVDPTGVAAVLERLSTERPCISVEQIQVAQLRPHSGDPSSKVMLVATLRSYAADRPKDSKKRP